MPEIQKITRGSHEQLRANKLNNLGEMDELIETHNVLILNQKEIENPNICN